MLFLGIKTHTNTLSNCCHCETCLHRAESLSSNVTFFWFDFKYTNLISLEMFVYRECNLGTNNCRCSNLNILCISISYKHRNNFESASYFYMLTINNNAWTNFDGILFSSEFYNCYHTIKRLGSYKWFQEECLQLITKRDKESIQYSIFSEFHLREAYSILNPKYMNSHNIYFCNFDTAEQIVKELRIWYRKIIFVKLSYI